MPCVGSGDISDLLFFDIFSDSSLKEVASTAYGQVCAPYHTWAVKTAVYAGMYTLPTRDQLLMKLNETGNLHCLILFGEGLIKIYRIKYMMCLYRY